MFKSNLRIAWRNFIKDRLFTFLNLAGLSTGIAAVLFIFLWVKDERAMDRFHANDNRLYRILGSITLANGTFTQEQTPALTGESLLKDMPEVEAATGVQPVWGGGIVTAGDKHIQCAANYIDSSFFKVFSYPLLAGNSQEPFINKQAILVSDELAIKLFGTIENSVGKPVQWSVDPKQYIIAGVFAKPPVNSTMQFDVLFNIQLRADQHPDEWKDWANSNPSTFIVVKKGTDITRFDQKIYGYLQTKSSHAVLSLQAAKYSDYYLYNKYENGKQAGGRIEYVRLFSLIALFILVIACINFMNLSTAKAARRSKEIGIKKIAGASRAMLMLQYIGESMLMSFLSVTLAVLIAWILLPQFNSITGKSLSMHLSVGFVTSLLTIAVITGLVAGSYPAFYLSGFRPVAVLKGKLPVSLAELWVRKGLVVFQFTLSVVFIVAVLSIYKQMQLVQTINLGYNKDNIVSIRNQGNLSQSLQPFINEVRNLPGVNSLATLGGNMTGEMSGNTEKINWEGRKAGDTAFCMALDMDYETIEMLGIQMKEGRSFSKEYGDSLSMILNEAAVAAMGMKNPVGKIVTVWGGTYRVIGITKDFHYESLYEKIKPCFIRIMPDNSNILVKIKAGKEKETLAGINKIYSSFNHIIPFSYHFLDENYQAMYVAEERVAALSRFFAALAIIISCLGLFGLAAFTAEKRKKEIGIRKVIGASVSNIVTMLSADFLKLVMMATLIAFPLAWLAMNRWLNGFAYRIHLNAGIFVIAGTAILLITLLTIGIQSIKAAVANPVKALSEL
jgi:ABC-type antimicrobial peptide transport system permease subunit